MASSSPLSSAALVLLDPDTTAEASLQKANLTILFDYLQTNNFHNWDHLGGIGMTLDHTLPEEDTGLKLLSAAAAAVPGQ